MSFRCLGRRNSQRSTRSRLLTVLGSFNSPTRRTLSDSFVERPKEHAEPTAIRLEPTTPCAECELAHRNESSDVDVRGRPTQRVQPLTLAPRQHADRGAQVGSGRCNAPAAT